MSSKTVTDPAARERPGPPVSPVPAHFHWDRAPRNRWTFQHVRELVPTVEVWRGKGPVRPFERDEAGLEELRIADDSGARISLDALMDATFTDGFLVLKDGVIRHERYFNGMTERTPHLSQSVAKSITGTVAAMLVKQGLLDPAEPITTYLPELSETAYRGATLQHVLDMTTGVRFDESYEDPYSEMGKLDVAAGWNPPPPGTDPDFPWPSHVWELIASLKTLDRPHGETFTYRSIETDVMAHAMERASGRRLAQLVSEELWQKIGAEESGFFTVDRAGYALADGGFNATLRDYARFGQFILEGGRGLLPERWLETTRTRNDADQTNAQTEARKDAYYRNQFWVEDGVSRNLMCLGVFGQLIHVDFARQMVTVKLSTWPDFLSPSHHVSAMNAVHAIAEHLE